MATDATTGKANGNGAGVPAVFMGRDGVLIQDGPNPHMGDFIDFVPGAIDAVRRLNALGYLVVVVTNQPEVARGIVSEEQMVAFNALMVRRMAAKGARIGAVHACPFDADAQDARYAHPDHPDRKPNPGMILKAAAQHDIDLSRSFLIGDSRDDREAARRAGVSGFVFEGGDLDRFVRDLLGGV